MELAKRARLVALSAALCMAAAPAFAQQKPAQEAPKAAQEAPKGPGPMSAEPPTVAQPDWVKICNKDEKAKKEVCLTSRDLRAETGQTVASVAVRTVSGENKRFILAAVPPGLLLVPGIRVAVDQNQPINGRFSICFPNACYAELEITDAFFKNIQKGNNLVIQAMNQQAKTLNFPVGLAGFTKSYDGPAADPKAVAEAQKEMNEAMNKKAQDLRDQLSGPKGAQAPTDGGPVSPGGQAPVRAAQ